MTSTGRDDALDEQRAIDVRLLGPVTVSVTGQQIALGPPKQQLLAASLFAAPGCLVTDERLIYQIWDERPLETVRNLLYELISDLRASLKAADPRAGALVKRGNGGYIVKVAPDQVDMHRFSSHLRQAQALTGQKDFARAVEQYRTAIEQWGSVDPVQPGEPLAGLLESWAAGLRSGLKAEYHNALLGLLNAEVQLGRHIPAIPVLQRVTRLYPDDEYATGLEMLALCRAGQPNAALVSYHRLVTRLRNEYGSEPSPGIKQLHERILRQDIDLQLPVTEQWSGAAHDRHTDSATAKGDEAQTGTDSSTQQSVPQPTPHRVTTTDRRSGGVYISGGQVRARDIAGRDMLSDRPRRTP